MDYGTSSAVAVSLRGTATKTFWIVSAACYAVVVVFGALFYAEDHTGWHMHTSFDGIRDGVCIAAMSLGGLGVLTSFACLLWYPIGSPATSEDFFGISSKSAAVLQDTATYGVECESTVFQYAVDPSQAAQSIERNWGPGGILRSTACRGLILYEILLAITTVPLLMWIDFTNTQTDIFATFVNEPRTMIGVTVLILGMLVIYRLSCYAAACVAAPVYRRALHPQVLLTHTPKGILVHYFDAFTITSDTKAVWGDNHDTILFFGDETGLLDLGGWLCGLKPVAACCSGTPPELQLAIPVPKEVSTALESWLKGRGKNLDGTLSNRELTAEEQAVAQAAADLVRMV